MIMGMALAMVILTGQSCQSLKSSRDFTSNRNYKKRSSKRVAKVPNRRSSKTPSRPPSEASPQDGPKENRTSIARAELLERQRIVDFAARFKGTRYNYGGKKPETGFDCSGLVYYTFRSFNYGMVAGSANQSKLGKRIKASDANPGDLLFFGNNQRVSHVGIVSYNDNTSLKMIHSSSTRGVIEEDINASTYWKSRFLYARNVISDLPSSGKAER